MTIFKDILPNDNVLFWLGSYDDRTLNNVLVLYGGRVLILKTIRKFDLNIKQTRNDILNMPIEDFIENYHLLDYNLILESIEEELDENKEDYENKIIEIIKEVKLGVKNKRYPPHMAQIGNIYITELKILIFKYIQKISGINPKDMIHHLKKKIEECKEKKESIIKRNLDAKKKIPEKIKKLIVSLEIDELIEIQKEIYKETNNLSKKVQKSLNKFENFKKRSNTNNIN